MNPYVYSEVGGALDGKIAFRGIYGSVHLDSPHELYRNANLFMKVQSQAR